MSERTNEILFSVSLFISGGSSLVLAVSNILERPLPDTLTRVLGIVGLVALPVLVFSGVRKLAGRK